MMIGIIGLVMLYCIVEQIWWAIPFLILGVEVLSGFSGSLLGLFSTFGDGE